MAPELAAAAHQTEDSTMKGDGIGVQAIHEVGKGMREDVGKDLEKDVGDEVTRADATRRSDDIIRHENTPPLCFDSGRRPRGRHGGRLDGRMYGKQRSLPCMGHGACTVRVILR